MGKRTGYEPEHVLRQAAQLFRLRGFRSVTVQDIVDSTGLNRFTINAFMVLAHVSRSSADELMGAALDVKSWRRRPAEIVAGPPLSLSR